MPETFTFPLFEAQVSKLMLFKPAAELKSFETREALPFQGNTPKPLVRPRLTYVTLERAMRLGKTPGCKGCAKIEEGIPHSDGCHERFKRLLEHEKQSRRRSDHLLLLQKQHQCPLCSRTQVRVQPRILNKMKRMSGNSLKITCWKRIHVQPRKRLFTPVGKDVPFDSDKITSYRSTKSKCRGQWPTYEDDWQHGSPTAAFRREAGQV